MHRRPKFAIAPPIFGRSVSPQNWAKHMFSPSPPPKTKVIVMLLLDFQVFHSAPRAKF